MSYIKAITVNKLLIEVFDIHRSRKQVKFKLLKRDLLRIRQASLNEVQRLIAVKEERYRKLLKNNYHITHPDKARSMEQKIILQRAQLQAQLEGRRKNDIDIGAFVDNLAITSDFLD